MFYADKKDLQTKCDQSKNITHYPSTRPQTSSLARAVSPSGMGGVPLYELFMTDGRGALWIHRKLRDHWIATDHTTLAVFIQILLRVEFLDDKKTLYFNGTEVKLKRGQMSCGRNQMAIWANLSPRQVRTALTKLKSTSTLTIKTSNKFSIITLNNWEKYQNLDQQNANKRSRRSQDEVITATTLEQYNNTINNKKTFSKKNYNELPTRDNLNFEAGGVPQELKEKLGIK